jgi:hypothetical protein
MRLHDDGKQNATKRESRPIIVGVKCNVKFAK